MSTVAIAERRGRLLRGLRVTAGYSRATLGKLASIHPGRLGRIERDESRPRPAELRRLKRVLGIDQPARAPKRERMGQAQNFFSDPPVAGTTEAGP
jgi:transcriptional regulator with XRE-family HTH domain